MADRVRKVNYCYTKVPNYAGRGEEALRALREAGVNLLAYSAFPIAGRKAQMDFFGISPNCPTPTSTSPRPTR
jgi:hypothetical protein